MPISHKRENRQERRAARKTERQNRRNAIRHPELVGYKSQQDDLEAHLEREANRIIFGPLEARNETQGQLIATMGSARMTFVSGPAGTGKTFVTTSYACELLEAGEIERLVIARPMVGCDEDMGFLPGTEYEKYRPWLEPFFDVLEGKLGQKKVESYIKYRKIIAKPLQMMRGSTFRNAFVILDEAQNTTIGQMKMFLTRVGKGSRLVIDGDPDQSDLKLKPGEVSGLVEALRLFRPGSLVGRVEFSEDEIERDELVRLVVSTYRKNGSSAGN